MLKTKKGETLRGGRGKKKGLVEGKPQNASYASSFVTNGPEIPAFDRGEEQ